MSDNFEDICITWNNPDLGIDDAVKHLIRKVNPSYVVLQEEVGEQGTPHLQGYLQFIRARTFANLKKQLGAKIHFEQRMAPTAEAAAAYCKPGYVKTGTVGRTVEHGVFREFEKRTKGQRFADAAASQAWPAFLAWGKAEDSGYLMLNLRRLREYHDAMHVDIVRGPHYAEYHFGVTGSGKSTMARDRAGVGFYPFAPSANGAYYWGRYADQDSMVCEEANAVPYHHFLQVLDEGACNVNVCGSFRNIRIVRSYLCGKAWPSAISRAPGGGDLMRRINKWVLHTRFPDGSFNFVEWEGGQPDNWPQDDTVQAALNLVPPVLEGNTMLLGQEGCPYPGWSHE